jgi:hypothetical protein
MDKFNPKISKKPRFPEAVIPPTEWVSSSAANDNMIQQRNIHSSSSFPKLPRELDIGGTW